MPRSSLIFLAAACLLTPHAQAQYSYDVGREVERLRFKDIRYLSRSLKDLPDGKVYVLAFLNTSCPLAKRYLPTLNRLEKEYRDKGVRFVGINVDPNDSIRAMAAQAVEHEVEFPFVQDTDGGWVQAMMIKRTPEVAVLKGRRDLVYRGRIDDQYRHGGALPKPTKSELKDAIDATLAGKIVAAAHVEGDGCPLTPPAKLASGDDLTFAEHVAPILAKHCAECHRPGTAAPFLLHTYDQVAGKANVIAQVVRDERMPPWYAAPGHGDFTNRRGLSAKERDTILRWAKSEKKRGDDSKLPKAPEAATGWRIGKPDLVVQAPEHELPADGIVDYKYVVLPHVFLSDTWVQGVQILPDNPRVLHHCNMAFIKVGEKWKMENFITGTVPGGEPMTMEKGVGFKIPAGSVLLLQVHYVTTGKKEKCRIGVGLKFASGKIDQHLRFMLLVDNKFAIPPGAPAHRVAASRVLKHDAVGVGMFTHMHVRGRDMTFKAHTPDGKSETLLIVPNYNFDWQMAYRWAPGARRFPKGTRLEAIAHYDNSPFNPFNPDPKATVRDGQQTFHEMMNGFVFYLDADEKLGLEIDGKTGRAKKSK